MLYGRGVTDCLGHVAMMCNVFKQLAIIKPKLQATIAGVFIANEEASSELGIGVDELEKRGELKFLKNGPLYWVDSANIGPTMGTGGVQTWELNATGRSFHSGFPQKAINAIHLATEIVTYLEGRLHKDFSFGDKEKEYKFEIGSSIKPTQLSVPPSSLNIIPGECKISGDIRISPFYTVEQIKGAVEKYMSELDVTSLPTHGYGKYVVVDGQTTYKGKAELKWLGNPYRGVAVDLTSKGYKALLEAIEVVCGESNPFSLTGSLPVIKDLQDAGFDVQVVGFGRMEAYHAENEYAFLSGFQKGAKIVARCIESLE